MFLLVLADGTVCPLVSGDALVSSQAELCTDFLVLLLVSIGRSASDGFCRGVHQVDYYSRRFSLCVVPGFLPGISTFH